MPSASATWLVEAVAKPSLFKQRRHNADAFFEPDDAGLAAQAERNDRPNGGMASKRHLVQRRKNTRLGSVEIAVRLTEKDRLAKIELVGDGLHLAIQQPVRIGDHGQLIAREAFTSEDIEQQIGQLQLLTSGSA
jgi:hypothetical protein